MLVALYADHNSMIKVGKTIGDRIGNAFSSDTNQSFRISRQTVFNTICKTAMLEAPISHKETPSELYIMADEKYVHLNTGKNRIVKAAVIFEGIEGTKRKTLTNKFHVMSMQDMFWDTVADVLYERYDVTKIKRIYFMGDGAHWIKESVKCINLENTSNKFLLDKFHFKQALNRITKDKDIQSFLETLFFNRKNEDFQKTVDQIKENSVDRTDAIDQQVKYLMNHQSSIRQAYKYNISCSMESSISHTLASNFTRNPKAYSSDSLEIYVNHRMNYLNGYNLKQLYLQSISLDEHDGVKHLKNSEFDWSVFDKKKHQTKFDAKLHINFITSLLEYK